MKTFLFIGGTSFLGSKLILSLIKKRNKIFVLTSNPKLASQLFKVHPNITIVAGKLRDTNLIEGILVKNKIDTIMHLASNLVPGSSDKDYKKEEKEIILPTYNLIKIASKLNLKIVYFSSGGMVYGKSDSVISEITKRNPINHYGYSKLLIEDCILSNAEKENLKYLILRPSNIYGRLRGARENQGFIELAVKKMVKKEPIVIWGDGNQTRDYLYISDLVYAVTELLNKNITMKAFNLAYGSSYNLLEVVKKIENQLRIKSSLVFQKERPIDTNKIEFDTSLLQSTIDFNPLSLNLGIGHYLKDYFNFNDEN